MCSCRALHAQESTSLSRTSAAVWPCAYPDGTVRHATDGGAELPRSLCSSCPCPRIAAAITTGRCSAAPGGVCFAPRPTRRASAPFGPKSPGVSTETGLLVRAPTGALTSPQLAPGAGAGSPGAGRAGRLGYFELIKSEGFAGTSSDEVALTNDLGSCTGRAGPDGLVGHPRGHPWCNDKDGRPIASRPDWPFLCACSGPGQVFNLP